MNVLTKAAVERSGVQLDRLVSAFRSAASLEVSLADYCSAVFTVTPDPDISSAVLRIRSAHSRHFELLLGWIKDLGGTYSAAV